jgi:hypothetical protein
MRTVRALRPREPLREWAPGLMHPVADFIDALPPDPDGVVPLVEDRMPYGWRTPAGPYEGVTAGHKGVRVQIAANRQRALTHEWWAANPDCFVTVHSDIAHVEALSEVSLSVTASTAA